MQRPLTIFIVGTTAVGKTKLSIQLCKAIGGEVINCDSKQLYKHASIMTAKATPLEIQGVRHHMLDVLNLQQNCFNRNKYFTQAKKCLDEIKSRGKVPVIVGGTNYYLQTLLYDIKIHNDEQNKNQQSQLIQSNETNHNKSTITKEQISKMNKQQKYDQLKEVDPLMAQKLHPNDETRVTSFLQRYSETGIPPSLSYKPYVHSLRCPNSLLFWLRNSDKKQLHSLMTQRVYKMVEEGGLLEVLTIFKYANMYGFAKGLNSGALQSIGYKQFEEVYEYVKQELTDDQFDQQKRSFSEVEEFVGTKMEQIRQKLQKTSVKSIKNNKTVTLLNKCTQVLIKNTIDYSKRQVTWIKNRLFSYPDNNSNFFALQLSGNQKDNTPLMERFTNQVRLRAIQIVKQVTQNGFGSIKQNLNEFHVSQHQGIKEWKKYNCEDCSVQLNGTHEWNEHLRSKKHRGTITKKERKNEILLEKNKKKEIHLAKSKKEEESQKSGDQQNQQREIKSEDGNQKTQKMNELNEQQKREDAGNRSESSEKQKSKN